jgi:membrane associated rhomboid family serine protease
MRVPRVPSIRVLGQVLPATLLAVMGLTFGLSILGALLPGLLGAAALVPALVFEGQVWRLFTWVFFETSPIGLVFAILMLWWFGRELAYAWGPWRFLVIYLGLAGATAGVVCALAATLLPKLAALGWAAAFPMTQALILAWAVLFPFRQILVYFLFPLGGRNLIYLNVGLTALWGVFYGFALVLPHFVAMGLMAVYERDPAIEYWWLRLRMALSGTGRRRPRHLKAVEKGREEPPRWVH